MTFSANPLSVSGIDQVTMSAFVRSPKLIMSMIDNFVRKTFIIDTVFKGREYAQGGALLLEQEALLQDGLGADERIMPAAEYPMGDVQNGTVVSIPMPKFGRKVLVTDEEIARLAIDKVKRSLIGLTNTIVGTLEGSAAALVQSATTQTVAAAAAWTQTNHPFGDIARAAGVLQAREEGYAADTLLLDATSYSMLTGSEKFLAANTVMTMTPTGEGQTPGRTPQLYIPSLGITVYALRQLPTRKAILLDSNRFGGLGIEQLGGGYVAGLVAPIEVKTYREENKDAVTIQARRTAVPYVLAPNAAVEITGV